MGVILVLFFIYIYVSDVKFLFEFGVYLILVIVLVYVYLKLNRNLVLLISLYMLNNFILFIWIIIVVFSKWFKNIFLSSSYNGKLLKRGIVLLLGWKWKFKNRSVY